MSCSEWKEYRLEDICEMKYGKMPKKDRISEVGYPIFSGYRIVGYYDEYMYENPEVIVVARGVGGTGDVKLSPPKSYITNLSIALQLNEKIVHKKFMYYKLSNENLRLLDSGSAQSQITINDLKRYIINIPPLKEQEKIANILSSLDDKIELNNEMNKTLEEMAQSIFKRWFVDFEFPNEDGQPYKSSGGEMVESELGMIPKGWEVTNIDDICIKVTSGGTPSRKNKDYYDGDIIWIKTKELNDTFLFDSEEKISSIGLEKSSAKLFPPKTVMIAMYGATVGKLGISSTMITFNQATCGMVVNSEVCCYEYLYLHLINQREKLKNLAIGSAQQNLSVSVVKEYNIIKPTKKIMNEFKHIIKPIYEEVELNQSNILDLKSLRDELLPKLMSGEIK